MTIRFVSTGKTDMKSPKIIATTITFVVSYFSPNAVWPHTIERSELSDVRTRVEQDAGRPRKLHVRLSMTDSKRLIGKARLKKSGQTIQLFLPLHWFELFSKNRMSWYSDFFVNIPPVTEKVTIGKQNVEIWPEDKGAEKLEGDEVRVRDIALKQFELDCPKIDPFDTIVRVYRYKAPHSITHWQSNEPGFEVTVFYQNCRMTYQIINFEIRKAFKAAD